MMDERSLRIRAVVGRHTVVLTILLISLAIGGGYVTYTAYADPGTRTQEQTVSSWSSTGEFEHRAIVQKDTAAFDNGTVLRDQDVYYQELNPILDGAFVFDYRATDGGDLQGSIDVVLVHRSVDTRDERVREYWRVERAINGTRVDALGPDEAVRVPFTVNVSTAMDRADEIDTEVGGSPGDREVLLEARLDLGDTRNGRGIATNRTYQLPIRSANGVYRVADPGVLTASGERTRQVAVTADPGPLPRYGGPILLVLSLGGLGCLLFAWRRNALTLGADREAWLEYRSERVEYDDWITTASLPPETLTRVVIEVESLEGLVDLAIDTDRRVIEDASRGWFAVFGDRATFLYVPPGVEDAPAAVGDERQMSDSDDGSSSAESNEVLAIGSDVTGEGIDGRS